MSTTIKVVAGLGVVIAIAVVPGLMIRRDASAGPTDARLSIQAQPGTPTALAEILVRSCGDCHSNAIAPRWYTKVPPFSAIMARAASEGRKAVDFSRWASYPTEQQRANLLASCDDVKRGTMPVSAYVRFRPDARLSGRDIETICSATVPIRAGATTAARSEP
jgi:hypothetical protein